MEAAKHHGLLWPKLHTVRIQGHMHPGARCTRGACSRHRIPHAKHHGGRSPRVPVRRCPGMTSLLSSEVVAVVVARLMHGQDFARRGPWLVALASGLGKATQQWGVG